MKVSDYDKLYEFAYNSGAWFPENQNAVQLTHQTSNGEILTFKEVTSRDLKFHSCYFKLLGYIWSWMPDKFKDSVPKDKFYNFLKHVKVEYNVIFEFNDGTKLIEYESVSFGKMSQITFENYIREQLPFIYSDVIGKFYSGDKYDEIIEDVEYEYRKFLSQL